MAIQLSKFLQASRWVYPLVNTGHVLGIALLVGAVVPMNLRLLGLRAPLGPAETVATPRPFAAAVFSLAPTCGALHFVTQAAEYVASGRFRATLAAVAPATANAALHPGAATLAAGRRRAVAAASLALWPPALILGRMIAYG